MATFAFFPRILFLPCIWGWFYKHVDYSMTSIGCCCWFGLFPFGNKINQFYYRNDNFAFGPGKTTAGPGRLFYFGNDVKSLRASWSFPTGLSNRMYTGDKRGINPLFSKIQFLDIHSHTSHSHFPFQLLGWNHHIHSAPVPTDPEVLFTNYASELQDLYYYFYHCFYTSMNHFWVINLFLLTRAITQHNSNNKKCKFYIHKQ